MTIIKSVKWNKIKVELVQTDITTEPTDAIVNAANGDLRHGRYLIYH
jgi:hypothetical protein